MVRSIKSVSCRSKPPKISLAFSSQLKAEDGQVTVLTAAIICAFVIIMIFFVGLGAVAAGKTQAQSAADFAALGAAKGHFYGTSSDPCATAKQIAERNSAVLVDCQLNTDAAVVKVEKPIWVNSRLWTAKATARAGPIL